MSDANPRHGGVLDNGSCKVKAEVPGSWEGGHMAETAGHYETPVDLSCRQKVTAAGGRDYEQERLLYTHHNGIMAVNIGPHGKST